MKHMLKAGDTEFNAEALVHPKVLTRLISGRSYSYKELKMRFLPVTQETNHVPDKFIYIRS